MSGVQEHFRGVRTNLGTEGLLAKTSATGIPARTGTTCGTASDVLLCYIGTDGSILETTDNIIVMNPFGSAIGNEVYITVKRVAGQWVVDSEDCS